MYRICVFVLHFLIYIVKRKVALCRRLYSVFVRSVYSADLTLGCWGCRGPFTQIRRPKLHLSKWERCVFAFPVYPHHTLKHKSAELTALVEIL